MLLVLNSTLVKITITLFYSGFRAITADFDKKQTLLNLITQMYPLRMQIKRPFPASLISNIIAHSSCFSIVCDVLLNFCTFSP